MVASSVCVPPDVIRTCRSRRRKIQLGSGNEVEIVPEDIERHESDDFYDFLITPASVVQPLDFRSGDRSPLADQVQRKAESSRYLRVVGLAVASSSSLNPSFRPKAKAVARVY